jgi:hypothetical protein
MPRSLLPRVPRMTRTPLGGLVRGSREQLDAKDLLREQGHPLYENPLGRSLPPKKRR